MTSDVSGTVTAIQGKDVSSTAPSDGDVLTWDNGNSHWAPAAPPSSSPTNFRKDYITASGTWTAPSGVTNVLVIAAGGGGGGGGGDDSAYGTGTGGGGGGGAIPQTVYLSVTAGHAYTITIGAGGSGGTGGTNSSYATDGSAGGATTFDSLYSFIGGNRGTGSHNGGNGGGNNSHFDTATGPVSNGGNYLVVGKSTFNNDYSGGSVGSNSSGGGGGAGPQGNGGNGGSGGNSGAFNGTNGSSVSANSAAGGGGGGGAWSNGTGGNGGSGGSGYMYILY
jgi:hypothetical protein